MGKLQTAKMKKPPKWHPPSSLEREYMRVLFSLTNELKNLIKEIVIPALPSLILEVEQLYPTSPARGDDFSDALKRLINSVIHAIKGKVEETIAESKIIGVQVARYNKRQFDRINNSVFGIDIFIDQPWLARPVKIVRKPKCSINPLSSSSKNSSRSHRSSRGACRKEADFTQ